ncbi:unnamed protein product [Ceutorhynchus assimilis]|uniref:SUN domain-containing protein n=1 Tax=Ceutorhynchus assimilis TaxID=467358 RepID=A0A9N9MUG2_9CUCU|nr:unnamed protein product [Ceutorhynchus assimilis]
MSQVGTSVKIINNDTPIVISRIDSATEALQKQADIVSHLTQIENSTETLKTNVTSQLRSDSNETAPNKTEAEDIPSFSEWAQKHLEEAEKNHLNLTINTTKSTKLRWKNYASVDCGAKVILANQEAQHTWAILVGSRDEYILNPCNSRSIWFIVELCEAIQLKKIDLANFELFSSSPKDFAVYISDRFPTRDWSLVGQFTAKDERNVQNFDINSESFGKYVKVEIKSHYGSEHYCPLTLFRAYGMSVFEALQKDDPGTY